MPTVPTCSVFDELSQDLPKLFDRYSLHGRFFPRKAMLLLEDSRQDKNC